MHRHLVLGSALCAILAAASAVAAPAAKSSMVQATIVTSAGTIEVELDKEKAPVTVENFVKHAKAGDYNNTIFHRVISNFMIQGGGMTADMKPKDEGATIKNESANGLINARGTLAMARTNDPDSARAQFFINIVENSYLNGAPGKAGYAVFGKVVKGMDVVDKISLVKTGVSNGQRDVPVMPVIIQSITVK